MKKIILVIFIFLIVAAGYAWWIFLGPGTSFSEKSKFLYIRTDSAYKQAILDEMQAEQLIKNRAAFDWLAGKMKYWTSIKPGKYEIKHGASLLSIVRILRNGQQTPVNLVITKIRTKEDLARMAGGKFECDSLQVITFLNSNDSLKKYGLTSETVITAILPNTYTYFWNITPRKIFQKLYDGSRKFWTVDRQKKAIAHGLTTEQAYILASIIEEETNSKTDKPNIASVYLNRIQKGMPLQADPTVKFALKDFGLKRIYEKHLQFESPYNTYRHTGLPPGPVCTPSPATIDAVLDSPPTQYIYFVAKSDFSGTHVFTTNYADHLKYAREFQRAQNTQDSIRKAKQTVN